MSQLLTTIIIELINMGGTLIAAIIMRWLLELSTPKKDLLWIRSTSVYKFVDKLQFYRGKELLYQLKAKRVYTSSNGQSG